MRTNNKIRPVILPPQELPELAPPMPPRLTPDELEEIAAYIFTPGRWKSPLARALNTTYRTVARWASGESPIEGPTVACIWFLAGRHPLQTGTYRLTSAERSRRARVRRIPKVRQPERYLLP